MRRLLGPLAGQRDLTLLAFGLSFLFFALIVFRLGAASAGFPDRAESFAVTVAGERIGVIADPEHLTALTRVIQVSVG